MQPQAQACPDRRKLLQQVFLIPRCSLYKSFVASLSHIGWWPHRSGSMSM